MDAVQSFYDKNAQNEWDRLDRHRTEFAVTIRAFKDHFPPSPADVLDVGGGPGRYSITLTKLGYRVMGPLYHLLDTDSRERAVREAQRVLRRNGLVFAAFISRYAPVRWSAKNEPEWLSQGKDLLKTGVWRPSVTGIPLKASVGFTDSYFAHPTEIKPLMNKCGFENLDLICCEGCISLIEEKINELKGDAFDAWVDLNYRLGKDPSFHGAAEHLLYIGRKSS